MEHLSKGDVATVSTAHSDPDGAVGAAHQSQDRVVWPLMQGLATAVADGRATVRAAAVTALFEIVNRFVSGSIASGDLERVFRQLLLPMFAVVPADAEAPVTSTALEWLQTTAVTALPALERLFCSSYSQLSSMLDEIMTLLVHSLQQRVHAPLAHVAAEALLHLVKETGVNFSQETWASVCSELKSCFQSDDGEQIHEISASAGGSDSPSPLLREVSAKVEAEAPPGSGPHDLQVLLLSTVYQLLQSMYPSMKLADVEGLLNCMHSMFDKAHRILQAGMEEAVKGRESSVDDEALHIELEAMSFYLQVRGAFLRLAKILPTPKSLRSCFHAGLHFTMLVSTSPSACAGALPPICEARAWTHTSCQGRVTSVRIRRARAADRIGS